MPSKAGGENGLRKITQQKKSDLESLSRIYFPSFGSGKWVAITPTTLQRGVNLRVDDYRRKQTKRQSHLLLMDDPASVWLLGYSLFQIKGHV